MSIIDPSLLGVAVTVLTNDVTAILGLAGKTGAVRGATWRPGAARGTSPIGPRPAYALFLIEFDDGSGFVTLEGTNVRRTGPTTATTTVSLPTLADASLPQ